MNDIDELLTAHAARWQQAAALPEARLSQRRRRPVRGLVAAASAAAVTLAGVGVVAARDRTAAPGVAAGPGAGRLGADADVIDRYDASSVALILRFGGGGAGSEAEHFGSLRDAYTSATAAVLGQIGDVRVTRTLNGVTYVGVVLTEVTVLRGALRDPAAEVVVEFLGDVDAVRAVAPSGFGVWLLRNKADRAPGVTAKPGASAVDESAYYRLVSSQGLFVQGETHVVNPVRERTTAEAGGVSPGVELVPRDPVAREAEAFPTLSGLVAHLRLMA